MKNRKIRRMNKEKAGVIVSSLLIVTACTITGVYINGKEKEAEKNNVVDFAALEDGAEAENNELAKSETNEFVQNESTDLGTNQQNEFAQAEIDPQALDQDLDNDPFYEETNSDSIINQGLTANGVNGTGDNTTTGAGDNTTTGTGDNGVKGAGDNGVNGTGDNTTTGAGDNTTTKADDNTATEPDTNSDTTNGTDDNTATESASRETMAPVAFHEGATLSWPVSGDVLMNYSMDQTIHFATLNQYKYNPALIIQSEVGTDVKAPAAATIKEVGEDSEIGKYIVMDLGGGYELTLGQLENISVSKGGSVSEGAVLGSVAEPSKYYSIEGSNVYMKLTKDGNCINPMNFLS